VDRGDAAAPVTASPADREIVITRVLHAPVALVFKAWTDPQHVDEWWGPDGFRNETSQMDVRPDGLWRYVMHGPDGVDYGNRVVYTEVAPPERLVYTHGSDIEDDPAAFQVTVTFDQQGDETLLTMRSLFATVAQRDETVAFGAIELGQQTLGRFEAHVTTMIAGNDASGSYADVNGLHLYYAVHGAGQPLVLLHGGLGQTGMFGDLLPALAADRQVIAVDLQAHGRTADIDRPLRYELMADDIAALIEHLGLEQADVMGYSLGAGVALRTAIQHPDRVRKLVVVSTPFSRDGWYPEVRAGMAQLNGAAAKFMQESSMYRAYARVAPNPAGFPALLDKMGDLLRRDYDWSGAVAALETPTMLVFGDADSVPPVHIARFFELLGGGKSDAGWDGSGMPRARLAILPGVTHYNIFSSPLLVPVIRPFLVSPPPAMRRWGE
jgi:pimeloyl-ACP methyl ester carboxylesterase/uncharacterized protein YndB with AHSA1/START domain